MSVINTTNCGSSVLSSSV